MLKEKISRKLAQLIPLSPLKMRNKGPIVSFTFDDFPKSAAMAGAKILEKYECTGTFYGCGGLLGQMHDHTHIVEKADIKAVYAAGHEIGCHTYGHVDCQRISGAGLQQDLAQNAKFMEDLTGTKVTSFAYPFGKLDLGSRRVVSEQYGNARTVYPGLNAGTLSPYSLKAYNVYSSNFDIKHYERIVAEAVTANAWLIFYTHDVSENPAQFGCTPHEFDMLVRMVSESGIEHICNIRDGMQLVV